MSTPVSRRISLLSLVLLLGFSVVLPRFADAVEPLQGASAALPVPGVGTVPAPDLPEPGDPSGSGSDDGQPTDIDQIIVWIRNMIGLDWPPMH